MNDSPPEELVNYTILIVDDFLDTLNLLYTVLTEAGYQVHKAITGNMALMGVQAYPPDLILLDIKLPDMDGYELCRHLKSDEQTKHIPVIFVSALGESMDKVKAFTVGGVDYITKPIQTSEVLARVKNQLSLQDAQNKIRQMNDNLEIKILQRTAELEAEIEQREKMQRQLEKINRELEAQIKERQSIQQQLLHIASHDPLTGLPNRVWFMNRLIVTLNRLKKEPDYAFAVLFLDCDHFKVVNDSLGHLAGDRLLVAVSRRLQQVLDPSHKLLSRFGGDEFAILVDQIRGIEDTIQIAQKILATLTWPFHLDGREIFINASIGIVLGSVHYEEPEYILRDADTAMYKAKNRGRGRYQVFDQDMHSAVKKRFELENDLRIAIENKEFVVYYQPIVDLQVGEIRGFEALVRWFHPKRGMISPADFIPLAEETGLIVTIGLWVLEVSCKQLKQWTDLMVSQELPSLPLKISVNLSVKQFTQANLIDQIDQILVNTPLFGPQLKLEITESAIMDNPQVANRILQQLKERKIQLSIDDFGTGYSSLSYLHRFPVDTLKIDRSFVQRVGEAGQNTEIIKAIIDLAHHLQMNSVAEGIETQEQLSLMRDLGCEYGQGFLFAKALPVDEATAILYKNPHW
ncbi:MAG: EAL domain-containing protein [Microcoleaceae cyanobacterium]